MSNKITGKLISKFEFNTDTGEMVCKHLIETEADFVPFEVLMRAYISLGAHVDKVHRVTRYGIRNEEDNKKAVERIESEFTEEAE